MKIELLAKGKDKLSFKVSETNHAYANALRRLMMSEVPTLAIEDVEFKKNNSILYDEMVAHRMGLIPLKTDLKNVDEKTKIEFTLKAKGPGYVYASELKTKDAKCKPVYPKTPIVKLLDKQEVELTATAVLGVGSTHVKWSPGIVHYTQEPVIKINNKSPEFAKYKEKYPQAAFNKKGELDEKEILKNNLVDACAGVCQDVLSVTYVEENFIFYVESWGQLVPKEIVTTSVDEFNRRLDELAKLIKKQD